MSANIVKKTEQARFYVKLNNFEIRIGKFYDPGEHLNGIRYEIRILHCDQEQIEALFEKLKEILQ